MPEQETPQEFRDRMRSVGFVPGSTIKATSRTITRPKDGGVDAGRKAKETVDEHGATITTSDNRQDVNVVPPTVYQKLSFQGQEA